MSGASKELEPRKSFYFDVLSRHRQGDRYLVAWEGRHDQNVKLKWRVLVSSSGPEKEKPAKRYRQRAYLSIVCP